MASAGRAGPPGQPDHQLPRRGDLQEEWPAIPVHATTAIPYIVYHLDRDIPLPKIPTTGAFRARRVWTLLDHLLTVPTLLDAEQRSRELTAPVECSRRA